MHADQTPYVELYHDIMSYDGTCLYDDLVTPWLRAKDAERAWIEQFSHREGSPIPAASREDNWRLYALSRISDLLVLSFAPRRANNTDTWGVATVSADQYCEFMECLGFSRICHPTFHPFFHEIVEVEQSTDPSVPICVEREFWPGFSLGPLLFSRSGCRVSGGIENVVKPVAEGSTLYWTYARNNRPTHDLSVGWGHNSQWRTEFRRDYVLEGSLHYNVDAQPQGENSEPDPDLTADEKLELLRHRSFVTCSKPHDDRWPYDGRHSEET